MSTTALHPLALDYLSRLRAAGRGLPPGRLDDLCAELQSHLAEAIPPGASDAAARSVIERLGPPEEIVEAEQPASGESRPAGDPRTWREWAAIILLPLGGFAFGVGWLAGLVLLWSSRAWSTRDKLLGTLIVPGGIAAFLPALLLLATKTRYACTARLSDGVGAPLPVARHCVEIGHSSGSPHVLGGLLLALVILGPIAVAVHLARTARRQTPAT